MFSSMPLYTSTVSKINTGITTTSALYTSSGYKFNNSTINAERQSTENSETLHSGSILSDRSIAKA